MAILSLTSVMGPVLRSTSQRSPQRITAATTDSTFFHGKVENSFVRSPAGPAQLSRPTAVQRRQINKAAVHVQSSQWYMPQHRIPRHRPLRQRSTDSIALHQTLHSAASKAAGIWIAPQYHSANSTVRCSRDNRRSATLHNSSAATRQSTAAQLAAQSTVRDNKPHQWELPAACYCFRCIATSCGLGQSVRSTSTLSTITTYTTLYNATLPLCTTHDSSSQPNAGYNRSQAATNQHTAWQQQDHCSK